MQSLKASVGVAVVAVATGCASGGPAEATTASPGAATAGVSEELVLEGEMVFAEHCTTCHGPGGAGTTMAPGLNDADWMHVDGSLESIIAVVNNGVAEPVQSFIPMLPRAGSDMSDAEVRAVAAYVWSLTNTP